MNATHFGRASPFLISCVCLCILVPHGTCDTNDVERTKYPEAFIKAAQAFKAAPQTNRYPEGEQVWKELPTCPLISEKDTGTGMFRTYDYSKPSYILSSKDVL